MDFLEKLNLLMKRDNYNKNSLSKASGIPYTTIDNWYKRGYDNLQLPTVKRLCSFFDTSLDFWLKEEVTDPDYGKAMGFEITFKEMEHIKKYRTLDPRSQSHVDTVLEWEAERSAQAKEAAEQIQHLQDRPTIRSISSRLFAYYGRIAAAGKSYGFEDIICGTIEAPLTDQNQYADYTIGVSGDSMEPEYSDGDIVYVQKADRLTEGDIGIFQKDNCIYIKKVGYEELISINPKYDPIPGEDVKVLGKVIGKLEGDYKILK